MKWVEIDMQEKANGSFPTRGIKTQTSGVLSAVTSYPNMETYHDLLSNWFFFADIEKIEIFIMMLNFFKNNEH